jgi:dynein heavy chain, axonemal
MLQGGSARAYQRVSSLGRLTATIQRFLDLYNTESSSALPLALFHYAIAHLCRISRILGNPGGHALLVGMGGSSRSSLARVAAYIAGYAVATVDAGKSYGPAQWHTDLKSIIYQAGAQGQRTMFMLSDTQLKSDAFLEDINGILNTAEVCVLKPCRLPRIVSSRLACLPALHCE